MLYLLENKDRYLMYLYIIFLFPFGFIPVELAHIFSLVKCKLIFCDSNIIEEVKKSRDQSGLDAEIYVLEVGIYPSKNQLLVVSSRYCP